MIENYKLLNAATKLINTKHSAQIFGSSKSDYPAIVSKDENIEDYLNGKYLCWDLYIHIILPQNEHPLPVNFEYSELIDVIATEHSREMYDYLTLIKIVDSPEGWFKLPDGILKGAASMFFLDNLGFNIASCLFQRQEILKIAAVTNRKVIKLGKLLALTSLLDINDSVMFFPFFGNFSMISVSAEFDSILGACYEISIPYAKGFDDIKGFVSTEKNPKRVEKTALIGLNEIVWSDLKSRKSNLFYQFKILKATPIKETPMNIEEDSRGFELETYEESNSGSNLSLFR